MPWHSKKVQNQNKALQEELKDILYNLDLVSIPTRYPEELTDLLKMYPDEITKEFLEQTRKLQVWLKSH